MKDKILYVFIAALIAIGINGLYNNHVVTETKAMKEHNIRYENISDSICQAKIKINIIQKEVE